MVHGIWDCRAYKCYYGPLIDHSFDLQYQEAKANTVRNQQTSQKTQRTSTPQNTRRRREADAREKQKVVEKKR